MTLIVEDGSVVSNAESYISVADADIYLGKIGKVDWSAFDDLDKEVFLRNATSYMVGRYGARWAGYIKSSSQTLDWPRSTVPIEGLATTEYLSETVVPDEVKNACALLAFKSTTADLLPDETRVIIRKKVDVLETEYSEHSPQTKRYKEIDAMLGKYLAIKGSGSGGILPMVRVA